jgi:endonuclease/exonuclease/phosphatase family metal-dependent hydrolase
VRIFVRKGLNVKKIDILRNCREKDQEICLVKLETEASKLIVLSICRAPTGDFNQFVKKLDETLKYLYKPKTEFLICGDINTDYLLESNRKKCLSSLLTTYNLSHTIDFATRMQNKPSTAIDNVFMDNSRLGSTITFPLLNGLSDHDAQLLTINNIYIYMQQQRMSP